jgi:hypothetical protein
MWITSGDTEEKLHGSEDGETIAMEIKPTRRAFSEKGDDVRACLD